MCKIQLSICSLLLGLSFALQADTIGRYMNIATQIPKMEIKADDEAQTWARSARGLLELTSETIAETLISVNTVETQRGAPLFCLPATEQLSGDALNQLIQQTYRDMPGSDQEKASMTVSQVALLGVTQKYPCAKGIQHVERP